MNLLAMISIIIYTLFFIGAINFATAERKKTLNVLTCAVLISLGWWSFCNSFFFISGTAEQAWFWHKLGAIGWCGFPALTSYYFLVLTNHAKFALNLRKNILFFAPSIILIFINLFSKTTSLAQDIVMSQNGTGLTYQNDASSVLLWAYLLYVAAYFGIAYYHLIKWANSVKHKMKRDLAIGFIIIDTLSILFGVVTDVVFPLANVVMPALASVGTIIFYIGYFGFICRFDLFNINRIISSNDILKAGNNPIFVIDEKGEILKCSNAVTNLLKYDISDLIGKNFGSLTISSDDYRLILSSNQLNNSQTKIRCKDCTDKDVLLSASEVKDKHNCFICKIISCQDITRLEKIRCELELEQARYKKLAESYRNLANYDPLTNLPNRRYFLNIIKSFETRYKTDNVNFAIIFLDLDNFKHINDFYGHHAGDSLLSSAANKLRLCLEKDEYAARWGGDEFMLILPYINMHSIERKQKIINSEFQKSISFNGKSYIIELSLGYAVFSEYNNIDALLINADKTMYEDKKNKKLISR